MKSSRQTIPIWSTLSIGLIPATALCAILATVALDVLIDRPVSASVTTLLPGVAYAAALVMKVCIAETIVAAVIGLISKRLPVSKTAAVLAIHDPRDTMMTLDGSRKVVPIWGILSVALTPLSMPVAALAVLIAQAMVDKPEGVSMSDVPGIARTGVLVMLICIAAGAISALVAMLRREGPRSLPLLGLVTNTFLIAMFRYFEFYKLGFDQDRWAGP